MEARSPTAAGPQASKEEPQRPQTQLGLLSLPPELIEAICKLLSLKERVRATSCCKALWGSPWLLGSTLLWGDMSITEKLYGLAPWLARWLAPWLARRQAGIRRLHLPFHGRLTSPALLSLQGSQAADLTLTGCFDNACSRSLAPIAGCTSLTRLSMCDIKLWRFPPQLAALPKLVDLELSLRRNYPLDVWGPGAWDSLSRMTGLRQLSIASCGLTFFPTQLLPLTGLEFLDMSYNDFPDGAELQPLTSLTTLSRLRLADCDIQHVPRQLSYLPKLVDLSLRDNLSLCAGEEDRCQALAELRGLTHLDLSGCALFDVPLELCLLTNLRDLDLGWNTLCKKQYASWVDWGPLAHLPLLTRLNLESPHWNSSLEPQDLPPPIAALRARGVVVQLCDVA